MNKKWGLILVGMIAAIWGNDLLAQCSICTKTASQLGEGPASALNSAIVYLAFAPFVIVGFIGYRWWKTEKLINPD
jgi:hypothetical protein